GLWQSTCFELFICGVGGAYRELNFSPSSQWAAYEFERYREGRRDLSLESPPQISSDDEDLDGRWFLTSLDDRDAPPGARFGVSAVIEETDGTKSYWALAHPPGDRPDFHHPDCFAAILP
ncbi:MAG: hypothetical protein ABIN83_04235, partial [Sphingomicrobium sp.]